MSKVMHTDHKHCGVGLRTAEKYNNMYLHYILYIHIYVLDISLVWRSVVVSFIG